MIVASALGDLGIERRGIMRNGAGYERMIEARIASRQAAATRAAAEVTRRAALTPEQRAAEDKIKTAQVAAAVHAAGFLADYARGRGTTKYTSNQTIAGPTLNEREKVLQKVILARDYDTLFNLIPLNKWRPNWNLGKYSFVDNGKRRYVPFTRQDIRKFIFSRHYKIEPGHTCTDAQRELGVNAHWKKTVGHKAKFSDPSNPLYIWPMFPGGGYPGQRWMCQRYRPSTWVKIRKKVYIAAGVVTAAFLGPLVISKVGGLLAHGEAGGAIVGAGAKVGAAAKVGTAAKVATVAAKTGGYLATVQKGVGYINTGRTVNAIIHGDAPPPPIDVSGKNWVDWGVKVASDELARDQQKKITAAEEARMRAELEAIQREIDAYVPAGTPIRPDPTLQPGVRGRIEDIQTIERDRNTGAIALAVAIPAALLLMAA